MDPALTSSLLTQLAEALAASGSPWAGARLELLPDKGLAHAHVRLAGTGVLARIPKQSQMDLPPAENLAYQQACFERASAGGATPVLRGVLPPSAQLPRGALLVEEVVGRPARLPQDLPALAEALACIHRLPLPPEAARAPLLAQADPLRALADEIAAQAHHLDAARLAPESGRLVRVQLAWLRWACEQQARPPVRLVAFDGHPGNFVVREDGRAVLVDLEKCRYAYPGLDLAHATLYTSTTWDAQCSAVLSGAEVIAFYQHWARHAGESVAAPAAPWHGPMRRAMWLWSLTWCAQWRVLSRRPADETGRGQDWSAAHSDAALVAHVRERVDHYLSPEVIERVAAEIELLEARFAA